MDIGVGHSAVYMTYYTMLENIQLSILYDGVAC